MISIEKRESVKKDYDLIANQYYIEFGVEIEDREIIIDEKITIIKLQRKWHWFTHINAKAIIKK